MTILVSRSTSWPRIRTKLPDIQDAVNQIGPGEYREVPI
jgi:hypothetical protein